MFKKFIPDMYQKDIYSINYEKLKKQGIKCLLFDLDNTITPAKEVILDKKVKKLFDKLKKDFKLVLFSNNFPKRIKKFGNFYDVDIACISLKPISFKYRYILKKYNFKKNEVAAIGDQLITDILGGNKMKITTILIHPISDIDERETWFNREMEKRIFKYFRKHDVLVKDRFYD